MYVPCPVVCDLRNSRFGKNIRSVEYLALFPSYTRMFEHTDELSPFPGTFLTLNQLVFESPISVSICRTLEKIRPSLLPLNIQSAEHHNN